MAIEMAIVIGRNGNRSKMAIESLERWNVGTLERSLERSLERLSNGNSNRLKWYRSKRQSKWHWLLLVLLLLVDRNGGTRT
jgi:hypothetical protein